MKGLISRSKEERGAEVYLDGLFGREYPKFASAIAAGFGVGRRWEDDERPPEGGVRAGKGGESALIEGLL
jgi:hypothetical protein